MERERVTGGKKMMSGIRGVNWNRNTFCDGDLNTADGIEKDGVPEPEPEPEQVGLKNLFTVYCI